MSDSVCFMCGAAEDEVDRLFRGIHGWICEDCIRECGQLLARGEASSNPSAKSGDS